jgi:hypothetical protein
MGRGRTSGADVDFFSSTLPALLVFSYFSRCFGFGVSKNHARPSWARTSESETVPATRKQRPAGSAHVHFAGAPCPGLCRWDCGSAVLLLPGLLTRTHGVYPRHYANVLARQGLHGHGHMHDASVVTRDTHSIYHNTENSSVL